MPKSDPPNTDATPLPQAVDGPASTDDPNRSAPSGDPIARSRRRLLARVAILSSFTFSALVIGWAFSVGLRTSASSNRPTANRTVDAETVSLEYEASLSPEEYRDFARDLDRRLLDRARQRSRPDAHETSVEDARSAWKKRMAAGTQMLEKLRQQSEERGFPKGSVQWEYAKQLKAAAEDAPPAP